MPRRRTAWSWARFKGVSPLVFKSEAMRAQTSLSQHQKAAEGPCSCAAHHPPLSRARRTQKWRKGGRILDGGSGHVLEAMPELT